MKYSCDLGQVPIVPLGRRWFQTISCRNFEVAVVGNGMGCDHIRQQVTSSFYVHIFECKLHKKRTTACCTAVICKSQFNPFFKSNDPIYLPYRMLETWCDIPQDNMNHSIKSMYASKSYRIHKKSRRTHSLLNYFLNFSNILG